MIADLGNLMGFISEGNKVYFIPRITSLHSEKFMHISIII